MNNGNGNGQDLPLARGRFSDTPVDETAAEPRLSWEWASPQECGWLQKEIERVYEAIMTSDPDRVLWSEADGDSVRWPVPWGHREALCDLVAKRGDLEVGKTFQGITLVSWAAGPTTIGGEPAERRVEFLVVTGDHNFDSGAGEVFSPALGERESAAWDDVRAVLHTAWIIRSLRVEALACRAQVRQSEEREEVAQRNAAHQAWMTRVAEGDTSRRRRIRRRSK